MTEPTLISAIVENAFQASDSVALDYDARSKRRAVWTTASGKKILLDQERPTTLRSGQGFELPDGSVVRIEAAEEDLIAIATPSLKLLTQLAWHLGNRHLPTQVIASIDGVSLHIRADHVIEEMVVGLGGQTRRIRAGFDPERGAYARDARHKDHQDGHAHG